MPVRKRKKERKKERKKKEPTISQFFISRDKK
jgi:hypothetical protein